jgi:hypothetical protein
MPGTVASRSVRSARARPTPGGAAAIHPSRMPTPKRAPPAAAIDLDALLEALAAPVAYAAPPLDDESAIDELAFVLATEHLSMLEKISLLEQWRYDMLLRDVASAEGLCEGRESGALLQQINKALLYLDDRRCTH